MFINSLEIKLIKHTHVLLITTIINHISSIKTGEINYVRFFVTDFVRITFYFFGITTEINGKKVLFFLFSDKMLNFEITSMCAMH